MARPATSVKFTRRHITKQEKAVRLEIETQLQGKRLDPADIPEELTEEEAAAYIWLQTVLEPADILGEPDRETVKLAAISIARLKQIDDLIRNNPEMLTNKDVNAIRKNYADQCFTFCRELCLSPAARSKIGSLASKKPEDPLMKILDNNNRNRKKSPK